MGSLELLKETELTTKQTELVDTISSANSVLLLLIEDILQLVKVEFESKKENNSEPDFQPFYLGESLKSLKNIVMGYASNFSVHLDFNIEEAIHQTVVNSNRSKLHQILSNLLTNAIKASKKEGKVELQCKVLEDTFDDRTSIQFTVRDYGSGIPKSKVHEIFEPFVQLHNTNESKVPR